MRKVLSTTRNDTTDRLYGYEHAATHSCVWRDTSRSGRLVGAKIERSPMQRTRFPLIWTAPSDKEAAVHSVAKIKLNIQRHGGLPSAARSGFARSGFAGRWTQSRERTSAHADSPGKKTVHIKPPILLRACVGGGIGKQYCSTTLLTSIVRRVRRSRVPCLREAVNP